VPGAEIVIKHSKKEVIACHLMFLTQFLYKICLPLILQLLPSNCTWMDGSHCKFSTVFLYF